MPRLAPLSHLILERHRKRPDRAMYDIAVLGSGFRERDLDQVAAAYRELEEAGLVEPTGEVASFFNHFVYLYKPTSKALADTGTN